MIAHLYLLLDELGLGVAEEVVVERPLRLPLRCQLERDEGSLSIQEEYLDLQGSCSKALELLRRRPDSKVGPQHTHLELSGRLVLAQTVDVIAELSDLSVEVAEAARLIRAPRGVGLTR